MSQREVNNTIRIGVLGNVDSGKTTLVGVLTKLNGEFDDGRGYARSKIFIHPHEKETGRTSTITKETMRKDNKVVEFVDLAGHEKYFKTTIRGICNNCIDYVILLINGNMGPLTRMTLEHLYLVLSLRIPLTILITKIDMAPEEVINETIDNVKKYLKRNQIFSQVIKDETFFESNVFKSYSTGDEAYTKKFVPLIKISNKTGFNIDYLKNYLFRLERVYKFDTNNVNKKFIINNTYNLTGIGLVLSGICYQGSIKKGDTLTLARYNSVIKLQVRSIHDDFQNLIDELFLGETGCLAVKILDKNFNSISRGKNRYVRNGTILMEKPEMRTNFIANILISNCSVTIKENYQPTINSMSINQVAKLEKIINKNINGESENSVLRTRDIAQVEFKFMNYPEYINLNQLFIFRDGRIKGIGKIVDVCSL